MHWMSVKLADNFQIRELSWSCRFHITIWFLHQKRLSRNVKCLLSNEINRFLHEAW